MVFKLLFFDEDASYDDDGVDNSVGVDVGVQ